MSNISHETIRFVDDIQSHRERIVQAITTYGYAPEHNIYDYEYAIDADTDNVFVSFPDGTGILAKCEKNKKIWWVLAEPLASRERRVHILVSFLRSIFEKHETQKVRFELYADTRHELLKILPDTLRAIKPSSTLIAPIFKLDQFDPALRGNALKKIRSVVQQYYRDHVVKVVDAKTYPKKDIYALIERWLHNRTAQDNAFDEYYVNCVERNFEGFDSARIIIADEKPVILNGGWKIPNSNCYYKSLGLHDYSDRSLGDVSMVEELSWLKMHNYAEGNFGGGGKNLTNFKKRFGPHSYIKSYEFTVTR